MNNADFKNVNDYIVPDVFIICQRLRHVQLILKNVVLVLISFQSNPQKLPQSATQDMEGVEYHRLHHVWIFTSYVLVESLPFFTTLDFKWVSIALSVITVELTALYYSVYVLQLPY